MSRSAGTAPHWWRRSPPNRSRSHWACPRRPGHSSSPTPSTCATASRSCGNGCAVWTYPPGRPAASPTRPTACPKPPRSGSTNSSPTGSPAGRSIVDRLGRPGDRHLRPRDPRRPRGPGESRLGRHPHPPRDHRLRRHLPPRSHRRHPGPQDVLRPGLCGRAPAVPRRRHQTHSVSARSKPSASSPANPRRPARRRSRCTPGSRSATSDRRRRWLHPRRRRDREARRRHPHQDPGLGRPPPGRHPTRAQHAPDATPSTPTTHPDGCATSSTSATATASSPDARSTPGPATSTTPSLPTRRTTRPNQPAESRRPVPPTPPRQDHRPLALLAHARRPLRMARPPRHDLPRHRPRHPTHLSSP